MNHVVIGFSAAGIRTLEQLNFVIIAQRVKKPRNIQPCISSRSPDMQGTWDASADKPGNFLI